MKFAHGNVAGVGLGLPAVGRSPPILTSGFHSDASHADPFSKGEIRDKVEVNQSGFSSNLGGLNIVGALEQPCLPSESPPPTPPTDDTAITPIVQPPTAPPSRSPKRVPPPQFKAFLRDSVLVAHDRVERMRGCDKAWDEEDDDASSEEAGGDDMEFDHIHIYPGDRS